MRAISIDVGKPGAHLTDIAQEGLQPDRLLLRTLYTGICGTDRDLVNNRLSFVRAPTGSTSLILGHEAIARVEDFGSSVKGFKKGDMVVPMVRRPGHCIQCSIGRQDNCEDGEFLEAGIRGTHGFMRDYFLESESNLIKVEDLSLGKLAVLTEPLKNVMKSFDIYRTVSSRSISTCSDGSYECKKVVIGGAGPIGILFAMVFRSYDFQVSLFDRYDQHGFMRGLAETMGADFAVTGDSRPISQLFHNVDVFVDTTGSPQIAMDALKLLNYNGMMILFGTGSSSQVTMGGEILTSIVEKNISIVGSVDGSKLNYVEALNSLSSWKNMFGSDLESIITDERTPETSLDSLEKKQNGEIKTIIKWA